MKLYHELGVDNKATPNQIKNAYRKKAKETHPDRGGKEGEFEKVQRAFLVLFNPETRSKYDATGDESFKDPDNSQAEVLKIIIEAFEVIVTSLENARRNPLEYDIAKEMRQAIENKKMEIENNISSLEGNIKKTKKFLGRFTISKGQNFLEYMLKSKIEGINLNIRFKKLDVEKFAKALEIMDGLSFRSEPKLQTGYTDYTSAIQFLTRGA